MTRHTQPLLHWLVITIMSVSAVAALAWIGPSVIDHSGQSAAADAAISDRHEEIKELRSAIDMCGGIDVVAQEVSKGVYQCLEEQKVTP